MIRIGVIGLGFMGRMHMAAYEKMDNAQLVAVADEDPKRAAGDLSGGWGNIPGATQTLDMTDLTGTTDYRELLELDNVDVVDVCVPTPAHEQVAVAALGAGRHVLCEKPMALTSDSAARIAEAAEAAEGFFMPAMCMRFWPQWAHLKKLVDGQTYGRVWSATFHRVASTPPGWFAQGELSGGALMDLHIHDTDFVTHLFGMPRAVFSRGYVKVSGRTDHVVTQYLYDDGPPVVTAEGSWAVDQGYGFTMRYLVNFEKATAVFDVGAEHALTIHHDGESEHVDLEGDGYEAELRYFVDCVSRGEAPTVMTAQDAVNSIRLAEAEQKSIDTGAPAEM